MTIDYDGANVSLSDIELNTEPPADADTVEDLRSVFPVVYDQCVSTCLGLETCAVVRLSHVPSTGHVYSVTSSGLVTCHTLESLSRVWGVTSDHVTDIAPNPGDQHTLVTSSSDGCVLVWDTRQDTPCLTLRDTSQHHGPPVTSVKPLSCVATAGQMVVAGTEQVGQDSYLLFWDLRNSDKMAGAYWSVHSDDITDLQLSPDNANILASGSTDGLLNVLDISQPSEEDALVSSLNTNDSVAELGWVDGDNIMARTHTEAAIKWCHSSGHSVTAKRDNIRDGIRRRVSDHIYTCGVHVTGSGHVSVLSGSRHVSSPCLRLVTLTDNGMLEPAAEFVKAGASVRCSVYCGGQEDVFITGGEDGVIRVWRQDTETEPSDSRKIQQSSKTRSKPYNK